MRNGKLEVDSYGTKRWILNGKFHRLDGPAVISFGGTKYWFVKGKCHKLDGPAIIYASGHKAWWIYGIRYTEYEFNNRILTHWRRLFR